MWIELLALASICINTVNGDIYLQNLRGSNNRLNEASRPRRNGNRLFDSQNNNRGGYNVGPGMKYYAGSVLQIEWTNQHSCGEQNANCELIVQYMCHDKIRDGSTTRTIPEDNKKCRYKKCNTDYRYGMHEDYEYYETCKFTRRNKRLYIANQRLRFGSARSTRQNAGGTRRGYECPEERDYYPYWRPSPWKDVVIMTNDISRCEYYRNESRNVKSRFYCIPPTGYMDYMKRLNRRHRRRRQLLMYIPITKEECEKLTSRSPSPSQKRGIWAEVRSHNISAPDCIPSPKSRDNHLGNGKSVQTNNYNWTIPDDINYSCVLRMRYNISTNDFDTWETDWRSNSLGKRPPGPELKIPFSMHRRTAEKKGYYFRTNPIVQPFRVLVNGQDIGRRFKLRLAMNTAQFGRTFQDRSHAFSIIKRPKFIPENATIVNLSVRGKRGNIVQTYPATEYDFVPNTLNVTRDQYINIQWTGSNRNPRNNDGQGRRGTDRNNICLLGPNKNPKGLRNKPTPDIFGHYAVSYPADLRNGTNIFGVDDYSEFMLCASGSLNSDNDNGELDNAYEYYKHELVQCRVEGIWYYMCTRNNNFTNRSQKGKLICERN